ncbi:MAG: hypothetical protein EBU46_06760 [Nitrosomonadaceae bacterium]|nr:hypothetical protein [Nitrosomonadaceae bacterium]
MNTLDFHNENSLRNFPIKDGLNRLSTNGQFVLPNDFIVDMMLAVAGDATTRFFISKLVNTSDSVAVTISDNSSVVVGAFNVKLSTHTPGKDYQLTPSASYSESNGRITIWDTAGITASPIGSFDFNIGATELCMRVAVPAVQNVARISFTDSDGFAKTLTGNVTIQAESNLRFRYESYKLIMDAGEGLGLNKACNQLPNPIRSINGVVGDSNGDFVIIPADCAAFETITNGLLLKDTCAKPCVGCTELSELTNRAAAVESEMLNIKRFIDDVAAKVTQLSTLASYTYDCQDCN